MDRLEDRLLRSRLKDEISRYGAKRVISVLTEALSESNACAMSVLSKDNPNKS